MIPSVLAISDVLGTGWFAADGANVRPGSTLAVVGDGEVGLLSVLSARQMGAEGIIAMSRHPPRQQLAREFGATDMVTERGEEGVARIKELTDGVGADSVLECVGTQEAMWPAIHAARPGGSVGYVGVPHGAALDGWDLFFTHVRLHAGPAPVRRYMPELIDLVLSGRINPGKVFDQTLPLEQVADGYRALEERRAIKTCWCRKPGRQRAGDGNGTTAAMAPGCGRSDPGIRHGCCVRAGSGAHAGGGSGGRCAGRSSRVPPPRARLPPNHPLDDVAVRSYMLLAARVRHLSRTHAPGFSSTTTLRLHPSRSTHTIITGNTDMASDASPVSPVTVPLQVTYVEHTGHKVGIQAGFSPDGYRLYEFDTGGDGFWSGYSPQWWPEQSGPPVQNTYASGAGYTGVAVNVPVYLADASGNAPAAVAQATVAQIQTATGKWTGDQWQQMIGSNQPPLYGNYYGDFGASLKGKQEADGLVLWSVLFQLAGGLGNGFVVSLDAFPGAQAPASGSLQLGLSASELSGTANQIALVPIQNGPGLTAQGILYIDDEPVNVGTGGTGAEPPPVDVLFDTGTPSTRIWTGENLSQEVLMKYAAGPANKNDRTSIAPGHTLRLVCGGVTVMSFQTGTTVGLDEVSFSPAKPSGPGQPSGGSVNTGLQPFWGNRTTFNRNADGTGGFIALANAASPTS